MMGDYYNYGFGHMSGLDWIFMIVFGALIIWAIVVLVRSGAYGNNREDRDKALSILKERYAKGDIPKEEFEEKKKDLMK